MPKSTIGGRVRVGKIVGILLSVERIIDADTDGGRRREEAGQGGGR